jgi:rhodanese-related sulfurtransferase
MLSKVTLKSSLLSLSLLIMPLSAVEVNIKEGVPYVDVEVNGKSIRIERIQDTSHKLKNSYTRTSRPTPPFNIQPYEPIKGIKTIGELCLIDFLQDEVTNNKGMIIDARMPKWHKAGSIPHSFNIPFPILTVKNFKGKIAQIFGVKKENGVWNFDNAQKILIYDNGPWCQQGVHAMKNLVKIGYPKSKIFYYRGGMQYWQILGLTTIIK